MSNPQVEDLNGDGNSDMLCGDAANCVFIFWRDSEGNVIGNEKVKDSEDNDIIKGSRYSIPQLYDWNNDGLMDLIVGTAANSFYTSPHPDAGKDKPGLIWLYLNTGTKENYEFTYEKVLVSESGDTITSPSYSSFIMGDLDGDSKADIVTVGGNKDSTGYFRFWKNIGSQNNPSFADPHYLQKENGDVVDYPGYTRMFIDDYNNDGKADLLYNSSRNEIGGSALLVNYLWVSYGISDPVTVKGSNDFKQIKIYSVSAYNKNNIIFNSIPVGEYEIKLINLNGKVMLTRKVSFSGGITTVDISNNLLSSSAYLVEAKGPNLKIREKIIIK